MASLQQDGGKFVAGLRKAALGFSIHPLLNLILLTLAWCRPALHQADNYLGALEGTADLKVSRKQKNPHVLNANVQICALHKSSSLPPSKA